MSTISKTYTFSAGATITASEHNTNFDTIYNDYNGSIKNVNIDGSAAIADSKLATISTAGKVLGAALNTLSGVPSGAGNLPSANLPDKISLTATDAVTELTLDTDGACVATQSYHTIDTFEDGASDDCVNITGGVVGQLLVVTAAHTDRTVVLKHGSGNLVLAAAGDQTLDATGKWLMLMWAGTKWQQMTTLITTA